MEKVCFKRRMENIMRQVDSRTRVRAGGQRRAVWNIMEHEDNGEVYSVTEEMGRGL